MYANPQPLPADLADHYEIEPEDYFGPGYPGEAPSYFTDQIATFLGLHGGSDNLRALDVGAGVGRAMLALTCAGFDVWGLEPSKPFRDRALRSTTIEEDRLQPASIDAAAFPSEFFDLVTFGAVLEHLSDPSAAIVKAIRWLRPGGLVHVEVPSSGWLTNRLVNGLYRIQGLDYVANLSPMHAPYHLYEFSLRSFVEQAATRGYDVCHHRRHVCDTYLPAFLDPIVVPLMARTNTAMQLEVWLRKTPSFPTPPDAAGVTRTASD